MPDQDPQQWLRLQLEWIDTQLSQLTRARDGHRTDVAIFTRQRAVLPMRYHQQQYDTCTQRIDLLLEIRHRTTTKARATAQGQATGQEQHA